LPQNYYIKKSMKKENEKENEKEKEISSIS
jgi:hypothetical protein